MERDKKTSHIGRKQSREEVPVPVPVPRSWLGNPMSWEIRHKSHDSLCLRKAPSCQASQKPPSPNFHRRHTLPQATKSRGPGPNSASQPHRNLHTICSFHASSPADYRSCDGGMAAPRTQSESMANQSNSRGHTESLKMVSAPAGAGLRVGGTRKPVG